MAGADPDHDQAAMVNAAKAKGFTWPQYFAGQGPGNRVVGEWGVDSIPRTFIIGPDGTVLWTGHPAMIDKELEKAFQEHPPQLVDPKVVADADATLDKVDEAMQRQDTRGAVRLLGKVPAAAKAD